jgi:alanine-glyoxylate transaminase/serine-glyoxylate transaminase/serine-pyruvate transaminase
VLQAMSLQPMDLADPRVDANIAACEAGIRTLVNSPKADVFFFISNGHGVWESVVENLAAPGQAVLIPGTGHFSEQWAIQTEALGRRVVRTPWNPGWPMDMAAIEQTLRDDKTHEIQAVFAVHTDTASSVTNDLMAVRRAIDAARHPALLVADVVASLGCAPYDMEALGADVTLGASQKGLMCPPGIGILAVNERAMAAAEAHPAPRFYWDWARRRADLNYRKFCGTPPHSLMQGLEAALDLILQEGLPNVHRRHAELAGAVQAAVEGWRTGGALDFFCQDPAVRSVSVTTITIPESLPVDALRATARERFQVSMAGGLGPLTGKAFRIGHLGDQNAANILGAIAGVEAALVVHGVPVGEGGTRRALMHLAAL